MIRSVEIILMPDRMDKVEEGVKISSPNCAAVTLLKTGDGKNILFDTGSHGHTQKLINALRNRNLVPEDINYVILSHSHFDHNANVHLFKNAQLIQDQWIIDIGDGSSKKFLNKKITLDNTGIEFIRTPGHTEDSISILFECNGKRYALVGDAIKKSIILGGELKKSLCSNAEAYLENMKRLFALSDVIISGDDGIIGAEEFTRLKELLDSARVRD